MPFFLKFLKILKMINICIFYNEQICVLNPILILDYALTKYYISICFVNCVDVVHCLR